MPKCISCNEVFADQLRRCPHCGYASETGSADSFKRPQPAKRRRALGPRARRQRTIRFALVATLLGVAALGAVVAWPKPGEAGDVLVDGSDDLVVPTTPVDMRIPPPQELKPAAVGKDFQVLGAVVSDGRGYVYGTCSDQSVTYITVDGYRARINPSGTRFSAYVPLDDGVVEIVAYGVLGDTHTVRKDIKVDGEPVPAAQQIRLLSHAEGMTVHVAQIRLTYGPLNGAGPARQEEVVLDRIENRVRLAGNTFTLYRAPEALTFLRTTPQGTYTFLREPDGQEMVLIPGGLGKRGSGKDTPNGPEHIVQLKPFLIDRTEVACAQYSKFLHYMARVNDFSKRQAEDPGVSLRPVGWTSDDPPPGLEAYPVTGIAWYAAFAYSRWAGGRLPTEAEWERAATGGLGITYAWGNGFEERRCRFGTPGPAPADSMPGGASPYGVLHMTGNVREWCLDRFDPRWYLRSARTNPRGPARNEHRVVRGGSFMTSKEFLHTHHRDNCHPAKKASDLGFRVVRNWGDFEIHDD